MIITDSQQFHELQEGNRLVGEAPRLNNSKVVFNGKGNVLFCEPSVTLENSAISFNGNNALIYLCRNRYIYRLSASVNRDTVLYIGRDNYMNGTMNIVLSEQKHCFIGSDGLFSFGIWIRNADPHLVYSCETGRRLNLSRSVFIGDHVWLGQSVMLLKGTQIDSGSIVGAGSVVAGKKIPHNESWAGNPCARRAERVFWDRTCVHAWGEEDTRKHMEFSEYAARKNLPSDIYQFSLEANQSIPYSEIDGNLSGSDVEEKMAYLNRITSNEAKNRFVHAAPAKKFSFFK